MGHGYDLDIKNRKRSLQTFADGAEKSSAAKRQATDIAPAAASEQQERVRSNVRAIYLSYQSLCNASRDAGDVGAFQALLKASEADIASQRLAARLVPRFVAQFPDLVDAAAVALGRLYDRHQDPDALAQPLEEQTRKDALHGLQAVLLAAPPGSSQGTQAVKRVLALLLKLLPQVELDEDDADEPEEEGELAACEKTAVNGPWVRRVLSQALQRHPTATLGFCFSCLGAAASRSSNSGSVDAGVLQGVRLWLKDHLLREGSPSREGTPLAGDWGGSSLAGASAAAAASSNGLNSNGGKAGGAAARSCILQTVLETSQELQVWIMQQARGRASAPPEVRSVLETALQLLPAHQQLAPAKPQLESRPPRHGAAGTNSGAWERQQQQQQQTPNGTGPRLVNGMELSRSWSTPVSSERAHTSNAGASQQQGPASGGVWRPFPQPGGPICRVEPCLLACNLPRHVNKGSLQSELGAEEAWLIEQPAGASLRGCCVFKTTVEAAKAFLRHNGQPRFGHQQPLLLAFTDAVPSCSRAAAGAAAEPSAYVWASRAAVGDAESITDELRDAGIQLMHVLRVNNSAEPGTLLQTPSAKHAAEVTAFLLKAHPKAAAAAQQPGPEELPPLPPEPPPAGDWAPGSSKNSSRPPGAAGPAGQQQQRKPQQLPPSVPPIYSQQQQQTGYPSGFRRTSSLPVPGVAGGGSGTGYKAAGPAGWRDSPSDHAAPVPYRAEWGQGQQHQHEQHVSRWAAGPPPTQQQPWQPGASPGQLGVDGATSSGPSWQHGTPPQHMQQQQQQPAGRWPAAGPSPPAAHPPGAPPPYPGPPGAPHQQQQQHRQYPPLAAAAAAAGSDTSSPAGQPHPHMPQLPPGNSVAAGGHQGHGGALVLWQGSLAKQAIRLCGVVCLEVAGGARQSGLAPEPRFWPEQLQVNFRINVGDALDQYAAAAPHHRAVRVLLPLDPNAGDAGQLQAFIDYLNSKERAGMVKLPPHPPSGLGPRAVYLIVPRSNVCQSLQVAWDGRCVMLIAVVVPQPGAGSSGGGGSGGGGPPPGHAMGMPPPQGAPQMGHRVMH